MRDARPISPPRTACLCAVLAIFAIAGCANAGRTEEGRKPPTTTTTRHTVSATVPAIDPPVGLPASYVAPHGYRLVGAERCPETVLATASNQFAGLCSASNTGPGYLLQYQLPPAESLELVDRDASVALRFAGWELSSSSDPFGYSDFSGFGWAGWYVSFPGVSGGLFVFLAPFTPPPPPTTTEPPVTTVPYVVGQFYDDAEHGIEGAGLTYTAHVDPNNPPRGGLDVPLVESQSPPAGTVVAIGSTVTLVIGG